MAQFDQFANQGGAAAWDPDEAEKAKRVAEEQLRTADYSGDLPEPLGSAEDASLTQVLETPEDPTDFEKQRKSEEAAVHAPDETDDPGGS